MNPLTQKNELLKNTESKLSKMMEIIAEKNLDAVLLFRYTDIFYFSGTIHATVLIISKNSEPALLCKRGIERAKQDSVYGAHSISSFKELKNYLPENYKRIGIVYESVSAEQLFILQKYLELNTDNLINITKDLKFLKMIKNPFEIEKIRKAGEIVQKTYEQLPSRISPNMSERDISIEVEYLLMKNGHLGINRFRGFPVEHLTFVLSGENIYSTGMQDSTYIGKGIHNAMGSGASLKKIPKNEVFIADSIGNYQGYHNDTTRTFCFGEPEPQIKKHYDTLLELFDYVTTLLKPGSICEEVYLKTLEKVEKMNYADYFMGVNHDRIRWLGHGVGIEADEFPVLTKKMKLELQAGMTLAVEPKFYSKEFGGLGIETTFLITENGCEPLINLSNDMIIIKD